MVDGVGRPDQIGRAEPAEFVREVDLAGGNATCRTCTGAFQQGRRLVDGDHLGIREGVCEQAGDYARSTTDVECTPHAGNAQQIAQPVRGLGERGGVEFGLAFQMRTERVPVDVVGVLTGVAGSVVVHQYSDPERTVGAVRRIEAREADGRL